MNTWISSSEANLEIKLSLNSSPMHDPFVWPYTLQYETKLLGPWPTLVLSISLSQLTPARVKVRVRRIGSVALALVVRGWLSADLPLRPPLLSRLRPRPLRSVIVGRWKTDEEDDEEADRKFRPVHFFWREIFKCNNFWHDSTKFLDRKTDLEIKKQKFGLFIFPTFQLRNSFQSFFKNNFFPNNHFKIIFLAFLVSSDVLSSTSFHRDWFDEGTAGKRVWRCSCCWRCCCCCWCCCCCQRFGRWRWISCPRSGTEFVVLPTRSIVAKINLVLGCRCCLEKQRKWQFFFQSNFFYLRKSLPIFASIFKMASSSSAAASASNFRFVSSVDCQQEVALNISFAELPGNLSTVQINICR